MFHNCRTILHSDENEVEDERPPAFAVSNEKEVRFKIGKYYRDSQDCFQCTFELTRAEGSSELFLSQFVRCHRCCHCRCCKLFTFSFSSPEPLGQI